MKSQFSRLSSTPLAHAIKTHVVETVATSVALSVVLLGSSTWNVWTTYQGFKNSVTNQVQLRSTSDEVVYLDEVLTMSARMAASTGDPMWEARYWENEPKLSKALDIVTQMSTGQSKAESEKTDAANDRLIQIEEQAFQLIKQGQKEEAFQLLLGTDYQDNKKIYSNAIQNTIAEVRQGIDQELSDYSNRLLWAVSFTGISCVFLVAGWSFILYVVRQDIRRREEAEAELKASQQSLQSAYAALESTQQDLAQQAQSTQETNQVLEQDVGHLLDIVSSLEAGDFTAQAAVSDRITGLVADMLNQFIEEMSRVIATVNATANQVNLGANDVEALAAATSQLAQQQVESVQRVQQLMEAVNRLSQDTLEQAKVSSESFQVAQAEVEQGESEMTAMTDGFQSLRIGTQQITRRVTSLNAFVEMATQFAQAQKRVASLTRVLAFNASMVASRAAEQRDPEQFATVAREFEAIAGQVNDLAAQTNQSLETLQQRTQQIQSAVSGIQDDTQEINQLVDQFTQRVDRSSHSFTNLKRVTQQMTQLGQQVTQSSEAIASAAARTLQSIEDIQGDGTKTEQQSRLTQQQAQKMEKIAQQLLDRMQFFTLNAESTAATPWIAPLSAATPAAEDTVNLLDADADYSPVAGFEAEQPLITA
ncbi:methyl-accepting chemotaxis protein [Lyngbya confervoides]|uniref:Methyl-accepting chemotaxis protein n=1 Tax=Lyngbya confervoides BDU141951 TaxID=1574623 RepID=A0ABD4T8S0_9CYAN|nr:methyl-accepting chemotaxis protein [Lyngbya confervoides]MCM1984929.1 methyl-accepting chemotaxis protein [Lyngbya confervoides BDU141951]